MNDFDTTTAPSDWPTEQLEAWLREIDPTNCDGLGQLKGVIADRLASMRPVVAAAIAFRDVDGLFNSEKWTDAAMGLSDAIDAYLAAHPEEAR